MFVIPAKGGRCCALVNWKEPPKALMEASAEDVRNALHARFPQLAGGLEVSSVAAFLEGRDTRPAVVRCSSYHSGRVCLIGDAAHSTGGTLGQGANSALQDAAALADALLSTEDSVEDAVKQYTAMREPEGTALAELVGVTRRGGPETKSPQSGNVAVRAAKSLVRFVAGRMFPNDARFWTAQTRMSQTLEPFADILARERA